MLKSFSLLKDTQAGTRFDKRASSSLWENVIARITIGDKTGRIMSLECTKHMNEKDVHQNLQSVRDIRTLLLDCSPVTPNQQLKQSVQKFAALPADETRHLTSQIHSVLWDELSDGSDRSGVIAKELFNPPFSQRES